MSAAASLEWYSNRKFDGKLHAELQYEFTHNFNNKVSTHTDGTITMYFQWSMLYCGFHAIATIATYLLKVE